MGVGTIRRAVGELVAENILVREQGANEFIAPLLVDKRSAPLLQVALGTPLLRIERTSCTYKDQPVDPRMRLVNCAHHGYLSTLGKA